MMYEEVHQENKVRKNEEVEIEINTHSSINSNKMSVVYETRKIYSKEKYN